MDSPRQQQEVPPLSQPEKICALPSLISRPCDIFTSFPPSPRLSFPPPLSRHGWNATVPPSLHLCQTFSPSPFSSTHTRKKERQGPYFFLSEGRGECREERGHPRTGIFISCAQAFDPFLGKCPERREEGNLISFRFVGIHMLKTMRHTCQAQMFFRLSCLPLFFQQNSAFSAEAEKGNRFLPRPMFVVYWASRFQEEERAFPPSQSSPPLFFWWSKV